MEKSLNTTYVLVTAVRNEGKYIEKTINSIINQTRKPHLWVIISDGSTDDTDIIISKYAVNHSFIKFLRKDHNDSNIIIAAGKVAAINLGLTQLTHIPYEFIGCLDGDVTFAENYYEQIIEKMLKDPSLGLTGGYIYNVFKNGLGAFTTSQNSVGGAVQFFRRQCFEEIGGYLPVAFEDAIANISAKMHGWKVRSFSDLIVYHHKPSGISNRNIFKAKFNVGRLEHLTGDHPLFQFLRSFAYLTRRPVIIGSLLRIAGFWVSVIRREKIQTPTEILQFLRKEQLKKLNIFLHIKVKINNLLSDYFSKKTHNE